MTCKATGTGEGVGMADGVRGAEGRAAVAVPVTATASAALLLGALEVFIAVSFGTLLFRAAPAFVPLGIGAFLLGGALHFVLVGRASSVPGLTSSVQDAPVAVLAGVAAAIAADPGLGEEGVFATTLLAVVVAAALTGLVMLALGGARLGRLARYVPYPVQAAFLGGTGVILLDGGLAVGAGSGLGAATLRALGDPAFTLALVATGGLGLVLFVGSNRSSSPMFVPLALLAGIGTFYVVALGAGGSVAQLRAEGWLPDRFPSGMLWRPSLYGVLAQADVGAVAARAASILTVPVVCVLGMLLNTTGIELDRRTSIDVDRELRVTGVTNLAAAAVGSVPGFAGVSLTAVAARLGAPTRTAVTVAGGIVLAACLGGAVAVSYLPLAASGALLVFLGVAFVHEYVWRARATVTRGEYAALLAVVVVIGVWGYAPGVLLGLLVSAARFLVVASRTDPVHRRHSGASLASRAYRSPREREHLRANGGRIQVVELEGHLFFGTAARLLDAMQRLIATQDVAVLVVDLAGVPGLDATAVSSFRRLAQDADAQGVRLLLAAPTAAVRSEFAACGAGELVAPGRAFAGLDGAMEHAEEFVLEGAELGVAAEDPFVVAFGADGAAAAWREHFRRVELPTGSVLFAEGDAGRGLYVVESGRVLVRREGVDGLDHRVRTLGPGEVLGELGLYRDQRSADAVVEQDAVLWSLTEERLAELLDASPQAAARLHEALARVVVDRLVGELGPRTGQLA